LEPPAGAGCFDDDPDELDPDDFSDDFSDDFVGFALESDPDFPSSDVDFDRLSVL
jgi:hypothetical protein